MENSENILIAVGCVFLITWYGILNPVRQPRLARPVRLDGLRPRRHPARAVLVAEWRSETIGDMVEFGGAVACRDCGTPYPAGTLTCDCGGACIEEEPAEQEEPAEIIHSIDPDDDRLVCVHLAENGWTASLLKSYLAHHDIPCATGGNSLTGPYSFSSLPMGQVRILVLPEHAEQAGALIRRCF